MHKLYDWIWFDLIWDKDSKGTFVNLADFSLNYDKSSLVSDYKPEYRSKGLVIRTIKLSEPNNKSLFIRSY